VGLGSWFRTGNWNTEIIKDAPSSESPATDGVTADYTIQADNRTGGRLITSNMSQEQLRMRRMNLIEGTKFGRPFHENFMLVGLRIWLVCAPILFVVLTSSEVAYILVHLVPPNDKNGTTIIWMGALFIDIAMMFCTFGVAIKRRDVAEKRETWGAVSKREEFEVWFGTGIWFVFAVINVISQAAFLLHVIALSHDPNMNLLSIFVASRVVGFILGDASTAFFLAKVDGSNLKLIARSEREKAVLYRDIAAAEGERKLVEEKAEADILFVQIEVQQKREEAEFMASLKRQMFDDILQRRNALPQPNRSTVRRLDTGS
jgi:hypothetical protein